MATDRCPSCGAAVRAGDPWCTLCWARLGQPAEPVQPVEPPAPVHTAPLVALQSPAPAGQAAPTVTLDPLTAPLAVVLGHEPPPADPEPAVTWPCVECGGHNALDLDACGTCTAPFGGRIARLDDPKAARRKVMLVSLGAVVTFLLLLAMITFASTDTSTVDSGTGTDPALEQHIDYSKLPQG